MQIGIIGTGTIASAVVQGIVDQGHQITVSRRSRAVSERLAQAHTNVSVADNQSVLDQSQVIFLGLMADAAPGVLRNLSFRPDHQVLSLMAGASQPEITRMVAPAQFEATMIPFPGIATGGSPIMVLGKTELVKSLFGAQNQIFDMKSDSELTAYMSAQAVLSPAIQMVSDAAQWLAQRSQDPAQAETFLRYLVGSSLLGSDCAPLLRALDTPGGFNQRLRQHMDRAGMGDALISGLDDLERAQRD